MNIKMVLTIFIFLILLKCWGSAKEMRRKTNEEFIKEVQNLVGEEFIPLTTYKNSKIKVAFYHVDCGKIFYMSPNSFLRGQRCPSCGVISRTLKQTLTPDQFLYRLKRRYGNRYTPLSKYHYARSKMLVRCNWCNNTWRISANNLLRGYGCPYCSKHIVSEEMFKERVAHKNKGQFKFLDPYQGIEIRIRCQCNKCGYIWRVTPHSFYQLKGCPRCQTNHVYTKDEYNYKLNKIYHGEYTLVEDYKPQKRLLFKHNICGHTFIARPAELLNGGTGCPYCNESKGERDIRNILDKLGIKYVQQYRFNSCKYKRGLPFDFWIPQYRIAIEYDGIQHFQRNHFQRTVDDFREAKLRDHIKDWYCRSHNIFLIRIPYKVKTESRIKQYLYPLLDS